MYSDIKMCYILIITGFLNSVKMLNKLPSERSMIQKREYEKSGHKYKSAWGW
jgi:hypothetical protein